MDNEGYTMLVIIAFLVFLGAVIFMGMKSGHSIKDTERIDKIEKQIEALEQKMGFLGNGR